MTKDK